jgi:glycosyltransferase involved in cell wall biosynthesis
MNILYLTQFFSSTRGGAPLVFYNLAKGMSERGHKVYVICNVATDSIDSDKVVVLNVKPLLNDTFELPPSPIKNLRYITNTLILARKVLRDKKIELIHTNSHTSIIAGSILSLLNRVPMIASVHDVFGSTDNSNWKRWAYYNNLPNYYSSIGRIYERTSLSMPFKLIHSVSNATRDDILLHNSNRQVRVIYPSIDENIYNGMTVTYENFVLYVGRLVFYKKVDVLIRAFEEVVKELPAAKLVIVGEGPMEANWKELARYLGVSDSIVFTGYLPHHEKMKLLRSCSALVLPSIFEGFGLVILESFALHKPVLVSNVPPFDEIVDHDVNGFLLPHNEPTHWAKAIVNVLNNGQLCRKMGDNAAKKIIEKFNFAEFISRMESLYHEVVRC